MQRTRNNYHSEDAFLLKRGKELYNKRKPSLILCSDFHLREDTPTCWTGDFQVEQWLSVTFVSKLQEQYNCPVIHAGDLFHHWKPSPWLIAQAIDLLPKEFYTIYGQHDLPQHNWELRGKSGLNALRVAGKINVLSGYHYGQQIYTGASRDSRFDKTLVWHHMTYITPPYPGATGGNATAILRKYPQFDLIVTGDNHQSFYTEYNGRILVNPGNLTRQVADQIDYQPRVALWYAETNTIEWVNIPVKEGVITREHIEVKQQRDNRIDAFISRLDGDWVAGMSFEENLEAFFSKNQTRESVKQIIYRSIE